MKNFKFLGFIALVAVIGFGFAACGGGDDGGGGGTTTSAPIAPTISTTTLPDGAVDVVYSQTLVAIGTKPITWSLDGGTTLPVGLTLATTGVISGTPEEEGDFTFTVKATNKKGDDTQELTITIDPAPVAPEITTTSLPNGTPGTAYSHTLEATGTAPITWTKTVGTLPPDLELATNGAISGTLRSEAEGKYTFTVEAANAAGEDTKELSITVGIKYLVTPGGESNFTASGGGLPTPFEPTVIQDVINAIREDADGEDCSITLGDGETLNIGTDSIGFTGDWGEITLLGSVTSTNATATQGTIYTGDSVSIESWAEIKNTGGSNSRAINNGGTGTITVLDGTVSTTYGYAINNNSTGTITVLGGTVSATTGTGIRNNSTGVINVSGAAEITSANTTAAAGTINIASSGTATADRLVISGGTVSNTANGNAVYNASTGGVTISGGKVSAITGSAISNVSTGTITVSDGKVSATTGRAINNESTGVIDISGTAELTSAITTATTGTIYIANSGTGATDRLTISGGTVSNTATNGNAIYNASTYGVKVSGGTVSATTGTAIYNNSTGTITVSGGTVSATTGSGIRNNSTGVINVSGAAEITSANTTATSGTIYIANSGTGTTARLTISGGTVSNTANGIAIYNASTYGITVSGGTVSATTGVAIYNNSTGIINVSGSAVVTSSSGTAINIVSSGTDTAARLIISSGTISGTTAIYNNSTGGVTISNGTISATTGSAIRNNSTGGVTISGGEVSATTGYAIYNNSTGGVTISGGEVSATTGYAIYNASTGGVTITSGKVSATTGRAIYNDSTGVINISGTAEITSAYNAANAGTIAILNSGTDTADRLVIEGGTISNTSTNGSTIFNSSTGGVRISGGMVSAIGNSGSAIRNSSTGTVTVSGGTVSATTSTAIYNSTGVVTVSGGVVSATTGTVISNYSGTITVSGGTVSATESNGRAIENTGVGVVTVTGGTVSTTLGTAIRNNSTGVINISGTVVITSSNNIPSQGTIYIADSGTATADRLIISGGTISNTINTTANTGDAIYNASTGGVTISGGTVSAASGRAFFGSNCKITGGTLFAYGSGQTDVVYASGVTREGNGLILWWDRTASPGPFTSGVSTGLGSDPTGATKTWGKSGEDSGINYANSGNTGFIKVTGVTVN